MKKFTKLSILFASFAMALGVGLTGGAKEVRADDPVQIYSSGTPSWGTTYSYGAKTLNNVSWYVTTYGNNTCIGWNSSGQNKSSSATMGPLSSITEKTKYGLYQTANDFSTAQKIEMTISNSDSVTGSYYVYYSTNSGSTWTQGVKGTLASSTTSITYDHGSSIGTSVRFAIGIGTTKTTKTRISVSGIKVYQYKSSEVAVSSLTLSGGTQNNGNISIDIPSNDTAAKTVTATINSTATNKEITVAKASGDDLVTINGLTSGKVTANSSGVATFTITGNGSTSGSETINVTAGNITKTVTVTASAAAALLDHVNVSGTATYATQYVTDPATAFNPAGLTFTAVYDDESEEVIDAEDITWNALVAGQAVTGTYNGKTVTVSTSLVSVVTDSITEVQVSGDMTNKAYTTGNAWDPTGLVVQVKHASTGNALTTVSSGITWGYSVANPAKNVTSVDVTATVGGVESAAYTVSGITFTEGPYYTADFGAYNSSSSYYTSSTTFTVSNQSWSGYGFNPNGSTWDYIRMGGKVASTEENPASYVTYTLTQDTASVKIYFVANNSAVTGYKVTILNTSSAVVDEISLSISTSEFEVTPTSPLTYWASGYTFRLDVYKSSSGSNVGADLKTIKFYQYEKIPSVTSIVLTPNDLNVELGDLDEIANLFTSIVVNKDEGCDKTAADIVWESSDTSIFDVDGDTYSAEAVGTVTLSAKIDGTTYGTATIRVIDSSQPILQSITVGGTATYATQYVTDPATAFNPAGLTFTPVYDKTNENPETITGNDITWDALVAEQAVTGTYNGIIVTVPTNLVSVVNDYITEVQVSGDMTNKATYYVGDAWDPTGLVVQVKHASTGNTLTTVNEGITWGYSYSEPTLNQTSVNVTATVSGVASAAYTVTGIVVSEITSWGGTFESSLPDGWTTNSNEFYSANNGYKWNSSSDWIKSPTLSNAGSNLKINITAGYNTSQGSTLTFTAYDSSDNAIGSATFSPTETYNNQSAVNEVSLSASTDISYVKVTFDKSEGNCGMKYLLLEKVTGDTVAAFVADWKAMRDAGENGICDYLTSSENNTLKALLDRFMAFSAEDQATIRATADEGAGGINTTIGTTIDYMASIRDWVKDTVQPAEGAGLTDVVIETKTESNSLIALFAVLGLVAISAYYFLEKKKVFKR